MEKQINIAEWIENFKSFKYSDPDVSVQCDAGWYDWFCNDYTLANRTKKLGKKLTQIADSPKIDKKNSYVFFKNNCPCIGRLYDDFRICDMKKDGEIIFTIVPSSGHKSDEGKAEVWGRENNFDGPLVKGTWKDVLNFFNK